MESGHQGLHGEEENRQGKKMESGEILFNHTTGAAGELAQCRIYSKLHFIRGSR